MKIVHDVPPRYFNAFKTEINVKTDRNYRTCESFYNTTTRKYDKLKLRLESVES